MRSQLRDSNQRRRGSPRCWRVGPISRSMTSMLRGRPARAVNYLTASGPHKADAGDLGRDAEAHGRAPVARAAIDVHPGASEAMQPRGERLLQPHEQVPGPELAAVRVAGELQVEA